MVDPEDKYKRRRRRQRNLIARDLLTDKRWRPKTEISKKDRNKKPLIEIGDDLFRDEDDDFGK